MKTLRLLLWLRWKLFLRSGTTGSRIRGAVLTTLILVAFSPAWLGGAITAYAAVERSGSPAVLMVFGVCQLGWLSLGLLSGALGRTFDLDKFLRYPVQPRVVYSINLAASLLNPVPIMMLPAIVAITLAAGARGGPLAAFGTAVGGLAVLLVTGAFLQILLALLDEVLRHESVRYVATAAMTLMLIGMQFAARFATRHLAQDVLLRFAHHEITGRQALDLAGAFFAHVPTVAAPAAIATGALDGAPLRVLLGLAGTAALLVLGVLPGAALMRHTVRGGESTSAKPERAGRRRESAGSFAFGDALLPRGVALMLGRELRMTVRNPQRLISVFMAPLVGLLFIAQAHGNAAMATGFAFGMLASAMGTASLLMFAYDGAGIRAFYLLPVAPRDLLLAKNLELLARFVVEAILAVGMLAVFIHPLFTPVFAMMAIGALAAVLLSLAIGTWVSIAHPTRARQRGMVMRGNSGWASTVVSFGIMIGIALLGGLVWAARWLAGRQWADAVGVALTTLMLLVAIAVWWRSLELNARVFLDSREKLIEVLARTSDD